MTSTYALWQRLADRPLGPRLFSLGLTLRVPYFGTIMPTVVDMRPGYCEVRAPKWWGVRNHIGTFHAIACCNLAEVAMGMLAEATLPATHRWLPKAMTVEYLAKAETSLRAVAELAEIPAFDTAPFNAAADLPVPVTVYDVGGQPVVRGTITVRVSPKRD
ncbi:MAG TPA: hotdog fold domain-containing protein [Pseudonocardiaceae bacterium]|nr:hotdog fold domain-containing protein [Pseudonocardiaceae bacterium]